MADSKAGPRAVGAHVSIAGGLQRAVGRAEERDCDALQIFPSNPRGWALPTVDRAEEDALRSALEDRGWPLYLHVPYLVNPASPDDEVWRRSGENLDFALGRGERLGAAGVIVHAGHTKGAPRAEALGRVRAALTVLLERHPGADLCLEPTAGATGAVAGTPDEMAEVLDVLEGHPRVRFCLDTCHLWAAGVDYADGSVLAGVRTALRSIGPDRFSVIHLNDSKDVCGARRDRHQNLGEGEIGLDAVAALVTCDELRDAPLIVETPGGVEEQGRDVAIARTWS